MRPGSVDPSTEYTGRGRGTVVNLKEEGTGKTREEAWTSDWSSKLRETLKVSQNRGRLLA